MLDYADFVAVNKFSRRGSEDALRDVRKQYQRNQQAVRRRARGAAGVRHQRRALQRRRRQRALRAPRRQARERGSTLGWREPLSSRRPRARPTAGQHVIPPEPRALPRRDQRDACRELPQAGPRSRQSSPASSRRCERIAIAAVLRAVAGKRRCSRRGPWRGDLATERDALRAAPRPALAAHASPSGRSWDAAYRADRYSYEVRGTRGRWSTNYRETLSELQVRKVARPRYRGCGRPPALAPAGERPGRVPVHRAASFPFKRKAEDPTRMFAGEGPAERTNARFHYLADGPAGEAAVDRVRLASRSTARTPTSAPTSTARSARAASRCSRSRRPSSSTPASTCVDPTTSVSMTINGPAPTILAFFFNTAIRQQCASCCASRGASRSREAQCLQPDRLRGAQLGRGARAAHRRGVRARRGGDAEAGARHRAGRHPQGRPGRRTPASSRTEFALRMMGDVQQFFIEHDVTQLLQRLDQRLPHRRGGREPDPPARLHARATASPTSSTTARAAWT